MATLMAPSSSFNPVKVDVRLCGSVPRQELEALSLRKFTPQPNLPSRTPNTNPYLVERDGDFSFSSHHTIEDEKMAMQLSSQLSNQEEMHHYHYRNATSRPSLPEFEAPTWAVPAMGESRLEPVCDTQMKQPSVDLKSRAVFRIGRSPQADIQLFHDNSSRRHAMLFHHSNGACYLIDCGSAHGTYVNGMRVQSPPNGGVVIPYKVRRGSMIRFGGPGAPQFMLKSFTFDLEALREPPSISTLLSPNSTLGALVDYNTRLNSLGKAAKDSLVTSLTSKRSFDSVETLDSDCENKRMRCSSPPLSPAQPVCLVSPDMGQPQKRRRVSFSSAPPQAFRPNLISPDLSCDENDDMM